MTEEAKNIISENLPEEVPADTIRAAFQSVMQEPIADRALFRRTVRSIIKAEGFSYAMYKGEYVLGSCVIFYDDGMICLREDDVPDVSLTEVKKSAKKKRSSEPKKKRKSKTSTGIFQSGVKKPLVDWQVLILQMKELLIELGFTYVEKANEPFYCFDIPIYACYANTPEETWRLISGKLDQLDKLKGTTRFTILNGGLLGFGNG